MSLLEAVHIEGFRSFRRLDVEGLTRVNLIVGKNNAGKTALLNALELSLSEAPLSTLVLALELREETFVVPPMHKEDNSSSFLDTRPLFHGFGERLGREFQIVVQPGGRKLHVVVDTWSCAEKTLGGVPLTMLGPGGITGESPVLASLSYGQRGRFIALGSHNGIPAELTAHARGSLPMSAAQFMPVELLGARRLSEFWNEVVLTPAEDDVLKALKIVEPRLTNLNFLGNGAASAGYGSIIVRLAGIAERVSMASLGDGLKRMLGLSLKLVAANGSALLVDEIDAGLHHSTMLDMWRLVVETARRLDVQVFATTHRLDCVNALGWLIDSDQTLAHEVSLHRVEQGYEKTTPYTAAEIAAAARMYSELR